MKSDKHVFDWLIERICSYIRIKKKELNYDDELRIINVQIATIANAVIKYNKEHIKIREVDGYRAINISMFIGEKESDVFLSHIYPEGWTEEQIIEQARIALDLLEKKKREKEKLERKGEE